MTTTQDLKSKLKPSKTHSFPLQVQVQELPRKGKKRRILNLYLNMKIFTNLILNLRFLQKYILKVQVTLTWI